MSEQIKNLIVDGSEYPVEFFSAKVKSLVAARTAWSSDAEKSHNEVMKCEAAIRQLDAELSVLVGQELKAMADGAVEPGNPKDAEEPKLDPA